MSVSSAGGGGDPSRVAEFMELFTRHQRAIYLHALALVPNHADADDVLQDANLVLWKRFDEFAPGSDFRAWACKIVYYKAMEFYKRRKNHPLQANDHLLSEIAAEVAAQTENLESRFAALKHCVGKLTTDDRRLLQARYQRESDVSQIAEQLNRPTRSVYKSIGRIRRALLHCIERTLAAESRS